MCTIFLTNRKVYFWQRIAYQHVLRFIVSEVKMPYSCSPKPRRFKVVLVNGISDCPSYGNKSTSSCILTCVDFIHCRLRTADCALQTAHCRLRTADCALHTAHCRLRTAHCALQTTDWVLRMSNKSNSFQSDLLYFQKGPVPCKADYI